MSSCVVVYRNNFVGRPGYPESLGTGAPQANVLAAFLGGQLQLDHANGGVHGYDQARDTHH